MALRTEFVPHFSEEYYALRMLTIAKWLAEKSNDPKRKVGCVLTLSYAEASNVFASAEVVPVIGEGCNVVPSDVDPQDTASKNAAVVHAEASAITNMGLVTTRKPIAALTAFITRMPCRDCMEALSTAGVQEVYFLANDEMHSKWLASFDASVALCTEKSISLKMVTIYAEGVIIDSLATAQAYPLSLSGCRVSRLFDEQQIVTAIHSATE